MLTNQTLYLIAYSNEVIIKNMREEYKMATSLEKLLENYCLKDLTTLKGRIDSIRIKYNFRKHIPIYLKNTLVLFRASSKHETENVYINAYNVNKIVRANTGSRIVFIDGSDLTLACSASLLMRYYKRALLIEK